VELQLTLQLKKEEKLRKAKKIIKRIQEEGGEAYLVGGCVRDKFLGKVPHDYDITTNLPSDYILEFFPESKLVGKRFGVVLVDGIEVATFRKDIYDESGKQTGVEFVSSLEEDLGRRDFTINAVAEDIDGNIFDPYNGIEDLKEKKIKFVRNPEERIKEDPIRILRGLRFAGKLGFSIEKESLKAMKKLVPLLDSLPSESIRIELLKIMKEVPKPSEIFKFLGKDVSYIFPSLVKTIEINGGQYHNETVFEHCILTCDYLSQKNPLLRIAGLLHDVGKPDTLQIEKNKVHFYNHEIRSTELARKDLKALVFSNEEIDYITNIIKNHMFYFNETTKLSTYRRFMSKLSEVNIPVRDILRLRIADRRANLLKKSRAKITKQFKRCLRKIREVEKEDVALKISDLKINGYDLIEMGFKPGPIFSKILKHLLDFVLEDPERNNFEELTKEIKEMYNEERT